MGHSAERVPVLIAGGGPFGLTLSIELGRRGVSSILVDADEGTACSPQANATQARTMEHYRRLGFADEVRQLGLPPDYPTDIAYFTRYSSHELARFQLPSSAQAAKLIRNLDGSWSAAELPHRVAQKFVEEVLRRHAEACPASSLRFGWRLRSFEEDSSRVLAVVENPGADEVRTIEASFLVGADGARSTVRRGLGIAYEGETGVTRDFFGGKMAAMHFRAPEFYDAVPHARAWMYWAFNSQRRSWLAAVNGRDEFAFHAQLKPGESEDIDEDRARDLFRQAMGADLQIDVLSVETWTAGHALVAQRFSQGRVFIGGDAAHLFTPAGGLGYNTAVEDAVNLGWKLAAAVKNVAGSALLPSYEFERQTVARRNTGFARMFAKSIGDYVPHPAIEDGNEAGNQARAAAGQYLEDHARREFNIPGITFGGRYDGSSIICPDGTVRPIDVANTYVPTASPGGRAPHLWLDDGRSLFDLFGFEWTLLVLSENANYAGLENAARDVGMELEVVVFPTLQVRNLYEADLVIIRPDQIVAWRGNDDVDPRELLATVLGHEIATVS